MRQWVRVSHATLCGYCAAVIAPGDPAVTVTIAGVYNVVRSRVRCQGCAGEPVPDLPIYVERSRGTKRMQPVRKLAFDWKARQVGEDDAV